MSVTRRCIAQHISRAKKVKIAIKPIYAKKNCSGEISLKRKPPSPTKYKCSLGPFEISVQFYLNVNVSRRYLLRRYIYI
jgi:hypothetical protein